MSSIKILITAIHYPVASGRYIANAFKRMGHEVQTYGTEMEEFIWGIKVDRRYIWKNNHDPAFHPDLLINADSAYAPEGDDFEMPVVLWGVDNHVRDYSQRNYNALFLAHSWGARMNESNAHWLPCAYDPVYFYNAGLERRNDVTMIGVMYEERGAILSKMIQSGLKVWTSTGPIYNEYNLLYNRSKIALVKSACGDLAQRFFENMAQGCCVLSDYTPDAMRLGFEPYKDFWLYNGPDDAVQSAKWLIESGEWERIAANGQAKVQGHTWDNRAAQLLRVMGMSQ